VNILVVTGGRKFTNGFFIFDALADAYRTIHFGKLIHGGADGVDKLCGKWAREFAQGLVEEIACPADWENLEGVPVRYIRTRPDGTRYNVQAGFQRNDKMAKEMGATHGLIFPGGNGTFDMGERMKEAGLSIRDLRGSFLK
jgi:hypothetical protein